MIILDSAALAKQRMLRLTRIAQARQEAVTQADALLVLEDDFGEIESRLRRDMARRLAENFPRQDDGRLPLGETILLSPFGEDRLPDQDRPLWLVALSPERRREPQVITVGLRWVIPENNPHRWENAGWLWDPQHPPVPEEERWGVFGVDADQIEECLSLLDAGRFKEALGLFRVEAEEDVWDILSGRERYSSRVPNVAQAWAAQKKGRQAKPPRLRLFSLPKQSQQRKVSLMLTERGPKGSRLELEETASNARLAELAWKRPVEMDFCRFGILE